MSLKLRITAWFSVMILLLTALVVTIVFVVADASLADDPVDELVKMVSMNASRKRNDGKRERAFISYHEGVYCQLLDSTGKVVQGLAPESVDYNEAAESGTVVTFATENGEYYIYDMKSSNGNWIRGYIATDAPSETTKLLILSTSIILPLILISSILGGWIITKRSLRPIDTVISTVDSINSGDDLSKRLNLTKGPTEIQKLGNEFDKMFCRLESSFEAEKQFACDVSHELRTPITVALGECHNAKESAGEEQTRKSLEVIEKQCLRISDLTESLLSLTRLQQNTESFPLKQLDYSRFLEICCEDYASEQGISTDPESEGKTLILEIADGVMVCYNPNLMSRILFNLLDNARKYTADDGRITVSLCQTEGMAQLRIADNGIGISSENLPKIWNRFWQADRSRSVDTGVGLGLAMVKEMVEYQNGTVTVESVPGKGTAFLLQFPQ